MPSLSTVGDYQNRSPPWRHSLLPPFSRTQIYDQIATSILPKGWSPPGRARFTQPLNGDLLVVLEGCPSSGEKESWRDRQRARGLPSGPIRSPTSASSALRTPTTRARGSCFVVFLKHAEGLIGPALSRGTPPSSDCSGHLTHRADYGNSIQVAKPSLARTIGTLHRGGKTAEKAFSNSPIRTRSAAEARRFAREAAAYSAPPAAVAMPSLSRRPPASGSSTGFRGAPCPIPPADLALARREALSKQGKAGRHPPKDRPASDTPPSPARSCGCRGSFNAKPG